MPKVLNLDTHNAQPTTPAAIPANVNQVETDSKKKISDAESRLSSLESQFETFNCGLQELKKQSIKVKWNEKVLANILALLQREEGSASLPNIFSTGLNVPFGRANLPSREVAAGRGSKSWRESVREAGGGRS